MEHLVIVARAISHPKRLALYRALGERGQSLSTVAKALGLPVSTAHRHLSVLKRAQMITRRYRGREAIYSWTRNRWALVREAGTVATASPG